MTTTSVGHTRDLRLNLDDALLDYYEDDLHDLHDLRAGGRRGWPFKRTQVFSGVVIVGLAILFLVYNGVRGTYEFFDTPTEILGQGAALYNHQVRIGATVLPGSIVRDNAGRVGQFILGDGRHRVLVTFGGATPDSFKAGQEAVVEGTWTSRRVLMATSVMAKHPTQMVANR